MTLRANRSPLLASLALALTVAATTAVAGADLVRVGKASATTFAFAVIDIGKEKGIWAKYNLEVESIGFGGDARLQQAMVADGIDLALGSGPGMGFIHKNLTPAQQAPWGRSSSPPRRSCSAPATIGVRCGHGATAAAARSGRRPRRT